MKKIIIAIFSIPVFLFLASYTFAVPEPTAVRVCTVKGEKCGRWIDFPCCDNLECIKDTVLDDSFCGVLTPEERTKAEKGKIVEQPRPLPRYDPDDDNLDYVNPAKDAKCGIAGDETRNKCCVWLPKELEEGFLSEIPKLGCILDTKILGHDVQFCATDIAGFILGPLDLVYKVLPQAGNLMHRKIHGICHTGSADESDPDNCICVMGTQSICERYFKNTDEYDSCSRCMNKPEDTQKEGIWTAFGCIYTDRGQFIKSTFLRWGISLAGIIALLCIVYSAIIIQISRGDPEKIKKAQEMLTSCIIGLLIIIFSVFILKVIGVDILRIPGLG